MFASLVPGFPPHQASPYKCDRKTEGKKEKLVKTTNSEERDKKEFYDTQLGQSTFHDNGSNQCPISQVDGGPILPPQSGEKPLDNETVRFLEALLEFMVTQVCIIYFIIRLVIPQKYFAKNDLLFTNHSFINYRW